ncbi:phenoloxidase-activating factor 1-like [Aedes albopictus]|uniref:Peptidase S1 domain-containing protein n=1 Tax=Aedes albopictus TaxID=7160 RepID=A0ABM1XYM5_AEDAL
MAVKVFVCLILSLMWYQLSQSISIPVSPCSDLFSYRVHPDDKTTVGFIQLTGLNPDENVRLKVQISIRAWLMKDQKFYLHLYKPLDATYSDIVNHGTATYWIKSPVQHPLPLLVSINLNGKQICSGPPAQKSASTATMSHTFICPKSYSTGHEATKAYLRPPVAIQDNCGTNNQVTDLSINGKPSRVGQFPWAVPLFERNWLSVLEYFCTGTIVTDRHILTAAHCVKNMDPDDILAIPGIHNISDLSTEDGAIHANVQHVICHEDYERDSEHLVDQDADIAILRLKRHLHFTILIKPICLRQDLDQLSTMNNNNGLVSGWGHTENGPAKIPFYYTSTIVSKEQCGADLGFSIPKRARIFCGDGSGSVACKGDSGSAMAMKYKNRFYLRGVVSKAILDETTGKCDADNYAIYIDVPKFMHWILGHINDDDYDDGDDDFDSKNDDDNDNNDDDNFDDDGGDDDDDDDDDDDVFGYDDDDDFDFKDVDDKDDDSEEDHFSSIFSVFTSVGIGLLINKYVIIIGIIVNGVTRFFS